jgi:ribosomal protein S11
VTVTQKQARLQEHKKGKLPHGFSRKAKGTKATFARNIDPKGSTFARNNGNDPKGQHQTYIGSRKKQTSEGAVVLNTKTTHTKSLQKAVSGRYQTKQKGLRPADKLGQWNHLSNRLPSRFGLVYINKTKRNTHCSISNLFGRQATKWSIRGGQITGSGRKTRYTLRNVLQATVKKLLALGFDRLVLQVKGFMLNKQNIYKTFYRRFKIVLFKFNPGIAHNGCRAPKVRRL